MQGLVVGGEGFVDRIRSMLGRREVDRPVPALEALRPRPSLEWILAAVAEVFGTHPAVWSPGRRSDEAWRAAAAFLARRRYAYRTREIAEALGYASHGGVAAAVKRIESADAGLGRTLRRLEARLTDD